MKSTQAPQAFTQVNYPEPHKQRTRDLIAAHPEVKKLYGNYPMSAVYLVLIVTAQIGLAVALKDSPIWVVAAAAWLVGAFANHALWALIHDAAHNLILKNSIGNRLLAIVANFPIFFPSASSFRTFHLMHHRYQGIEELDADLAIPIEAKLAGHNPLGKALWFLFFFVFQPIRVHRLKKIQLIDRWVVLNWTVQILFLAASWYFFSWKTFIYFFFSGAFAVGLHPLGARWIQEHYVTDVEKNPAQETYSYYGPINRISFNVGYHNEHHDLPMVAWPHLPTIRATAPEFYNSLTSYSSWTGLLLKFIFDSKLSLYSRIIRSENTEANATSVVGTAGLKTQSIPVTPTVHVQV